MTIQSRRIGFIVAFVFAGALGVYAFRNSLVPATHPDHDHGIHSLDAGGRILVTTREGKPRNLVGAPGKVLVIHFFHTKAEGAADELKELLAFAPQAGDGVDFVLLAKENDFETLDTWLAANGLPRSPYFVVDPDGVATQRLNCKRDLDTMFFGKDGKLTSQSRGRLSWTSQGPLEIRKAQAGEGIE